MSKKLRNRRVFIGSMLVTLLFAAGFLLVQYYHIRVFKTTLQTLVEAGTMGAYSLEIGDTDIDFFNFSFAFSDLKVSRTDADTTSGILQVLLPDLQVEVGSLITMFNNKQFKVERFEISEPIARIELESSGHPSRHDSQSSVNLAHQIAQFYPAVQTTLEQFDIKYFKINRATLDLQKTTSTIEVRLLDLLVSDWNMRHLEDEASFHLSLGNQVLQFSSASFSFGSVIYDYHTNELDVLDYTYTKLDSLDRVLAQASGEALRIIDFDYRLLISQELYELNHLFIDKPVVELHIYPEQAKQHRDVHPIADLVKRSLGAVHIADLEILEAQLDLVINRSQDTLALDLPKLNLMVEDFEITYDSSNLMFNRLHLDVHNSTLNLNNDLALKFANLAYDEDHHVFIDSIQLVSNSSNEELLWCNQMNLYGFDVFHLILERELVLDSLLLQQGRLNLHHLPGALAGKHHNAPGPDSPERPKVKVGRIKFNQLDARFEHEGHKIQVQNLNGTVDQLHNQDSTNFQLRYLQCPRIEYTGDANMTMIAADISFQPHRLEVGDFNGSFDGLSLSISELSATPEEFDMRSPHSGHWESIRFGTIGIHGEMPALNKDSTRQLSPQKEFSIGRLALNELNANVTGQDGLSLKAKINELVVEKARLDKGKPVFETMKGDIINWDLAVKESTYNLHSAVIRSDSLSTLQHLDIHRKGQTRVMARAVQFGPWQGGADGLNLSKVSITGIQYTNIPDQLVSTVDSLQLYQLDLSGTIPYSREVRVYGPDFKLTGQKSESESINDRSSNNPEIVPGQLFGKLEVLPGELTVDNQTLSFQLLRVDFSGEVPELDFKGLAFKTPNRSIHVGRMWSSDQNLLIDSVFLVPLPHYIEGIEAETDMIAAQFNRLQFHQVKWDSLRNGGKLLTDSLTIDGFDVSIKRDKTLPEPEHTTKPYLLAEFVPRREFINVPRVAGRNGRVVYMEIGEKTGEEGHIAVDDISFGFNRYRPLHEPEQVSSGMGLIYNRAPFSYRYHRLDSGRFTLTVKVSDLPMQLMNRMVDPLEAAKFNSGHLREFEFTMVGDGAQAQGEATITYDDMHVELFKSHQPDVKNFGSELLTLLVDKIILKHSKTAATAPFEQERITSKGPVNYWVKSGIHAASAAVMKGKSPGKNKKSRKNSRE